MLLENVVKVCGWLIVIFGFCVFGADVTSYVSHRTAERYSVDGLIVLGVGLAVIVLVEIWTTLKKKA